MNSPINFRTIPVARVGACEKRAVIQDDAFIGVATITAGACSEFVRAEDMDAQYRERVEDVVRAARK